MSTTIASDPTLAPVEFQTHPSRYRHWRLAFDGEIARLTMAVDAEGGLRPGYELKLNSYDLGVDIELADAIQRIRFEHPEVRCVVIDGALFAYVRMRLQRDLERHRVRQECCAVYDSVHEASVANETCPD